MSESIHSPSPASHVRHPVWQGVQAVSGLWFAADWLTQDMRATRMLAAWLPHCRAYRFAQGDVLCFAQPQSLDCTNAPGLPLCHIHGAAMYSGPLTPHELAALPATDIGLVLGGQVQGLRFDEAKPLDLSETIDISAYALHDTYDCRVDAPRLNLPQLDGRNVRDLLGSTIPQQSHEGAALLRQLKGEPSTAPSNASPLRRGMAAAKEALSELMYTALLKLAPKSAPRLAPGNSTTSTGASGTLPARQKASKPQLWREKLARLAVASRIAKLIGRQHTAYLHRMMEMFEKGDLNEALRNALPLDSLSPSLGQSFGTPQRRDSLQLSSHQGPSASLNLGDDLQQHLRTMYRNAFTKFDREGKIDEAVFVLAELLNAREEALDYLVKHQRYAQAAELALGWDMSAAMIIRLLMLAGDTQRSVQVARRDSAFREAIEQLQDSHAALAAELRLEWGQALVASGDWLGAVNAVWPVPSARSQAMQWLLAAEQAGEELSARALVQRAALLPETIDRYAERIETMANPYQPETTRTAVAEALLSMGGHGAALRTLATHILPAVAADCAAGRNGMSAGDMQKLLKLSSDPYLEADVPAWQNAPAAMATPLWTRSDVLTLQAPLRACTRYMTQPCCLTAVTWWPWVRPVLLYLMHVAK